MPDKLLQLERVAFRYDLQTPPVLDGVDMTVARGESLAVVGPSGCGKSTLLNIIGTLERPAEGRVEFEGEDLTRLGEDRLAAVRNRRLGFVFQDHHLLPQCTLIENVFMPTLAGRSDCGPAAQSRGEQLLARVGLEACMHQRPGEVSGGQRQRAAVVRALINQPALILADEPTGSLDRHSAKQLGGLLVELNREQGVTLIIVTHSNELAAMMNRTVELQDGKLTEAERPT